MCGRFTQVVQVRELAVMYGAAVAVPDNLERDGRGYRLSVSALAACAPVDPTSITERRET